MNILSAVLVFGFFEQGWVCASRLSSIIGGSEEKDFIILWSDDARQAVQRVSVCVCKNAHQTFKFYYASRRELNYES